MKTSIIKMMTIRKMFLTASILVLSMLQLSAQGDSIFYKGLVLNYSIIDIPFAIRAGKTVNSTIADPNAKLSLFKGMQYLSMEQSIQLSSNIVNSLGYGITKIPMFRKRPVLQKVSHNLIAMPAIVFSVSLPYGPAAWLHEEWHRSVMVSSYTNSYNPFVFNKIETPGLAGVSAVSFVLDSNLVMMKENSNANFVRLATSGSEGLILLTENLQKQNFFNGNDLPLSALYMYNIVNVLSYIGKCADKEGITEETLALMDQEGGIQEYRDFIGFDYTAWAYDLFNPDLPYSSRGLHPYGNGYDRYIYGDKLTDEQYEWIRKQSNLSIINFISPSMFFISSITLKTYADGTKLKGNFSGRYYPTSFGNTIGLDLMIQKGKYNLFASPHINQNKEHNFPGLELMLYEYPVSLASQDFLITPRIISAIQPKDQRFMADKGQFTGLASLNITWHSNKYIQPYMSLEYKTAGWVKGNVFLDNHFAFKTGISMRFK